MGELKLVENEEGVWELYDDSYDITIHCETEDEMNRVINILEDKSWIPADQPPKPEEYVLLSFENFSLPMVGKIESLNASVSAGILMYQIFSTRHPLG